MPDLINTFSWSFSAARDFEECRRKRYWSKYASWGGWNAHATALQRAAYRLNKMDNRYSLLGQAVEQAVMWMLRQCQAGKTPTVEEAYESSARPFLNARWKESKDRRWQESPKKFCCMHEHYYGTFRTPEDEKECTQKIIASAKICLHNFQEKLLPDLASVTPPQELPIALAGAGDPESFTLEKVKIYAIPDYVYRVGERLHIHDWKAGQPREAHREQLCLYALWAQRKHGFAPENVSVFIEYLLSGVTESEPVTAEDLARTLEDLQLSVADMADYLEDGDLRRNVPLPQAEWDLAAEPEACKRCNFFELCKPELGM